MIDGAATAEELAKLRADGQASTFYLAIHRPATVLAARVNQTFDSDDQVAVITFDGVTAGAYTDVIEGMLCYVGSAAGAWDLGQVRVLSATSSVLAINAVSDIAWADNAYLTVVDDIPLWPRNLVPAGDSFLLDGNTGYSDQHANFDPVVAMGPLAAIHWLDGATVTHEPTAAGSWVLGGATLSGYSWAAPGAAALADSTTDSPTITYNAARGADAYRVGCIATADNGKAGIAYRRVFVFDRGAHAPVTQFVVGDIEIEHGGGARFSVTLYDQAALGDVRDRALLVLFAEEFYGGVPGSIGPLPGYENQMVCGWIDGETIQIDSVKSVARFEVVAPAGALDAIEVDALLLKNVAAAPTGWDEIQDLTPDKAYYHLVRWRSTACQVMDCFPSGDTHEMPAESQLGGSLWGQIVDLGAKIFAVPSVDRYGRLFLQVDTQMLPVDARSAIPTVMELTRGDWSEISIERASSPRTAALALSGYTADGSRLAARAPGAIPSRSGRIEAIDEVLLADQGEANALAGLAYARQNNSYPVADVQLVQNNRLIEIGPHQYVTLSLAAGDTLRGIAWDSKKFLPRRVTYHINVEKGYLTTALELEAETSGPSGITGVPAQPSTGNIGDDPGDSDFPLIPPGNIWFPPSVPGDNGLGNCMNDPDADANGPFTVHFDRNKIYAGETAYAYYPCGVRLAANEDGTHIFVRWQFSAEAFISQVSIYAIDGGKTTILNASSIGYEGATFEPVGGVSVAGFAISLAAGGPNEFIAGDVIASGSVAGNNQGGILAASDLTPGSWICADATGGPWYSGGGFSYDITGSVNEGASYGSPYGALLSTIPPGADNGYNRTIMQVGASGTFRVRVNDSTNFGDNTGSLGYLIRPITPVPARHILLNNALLYNICTP